MPHFNIFKAFTPVTDTDDQLRRHILWLIFIRIVLFTLLFGITAILQSKNEQQILPPSFIILLFLSAFYTFSIGSALILQRKKLHLRRFGLIQLLADTTITALLVYATGCSQSIFTPVFFLPILSGGLILYRIGGLIPAASSTISYGAVLTAEHLGYIPSYFFLDEKYIPAQNYLVLTNIFAVYGLTFFLVALLSGMLAGKLRSTEDALSLSEEKFDQLLILYKQIFDHIMTGIITVDDRDIITSCNPAAEEITGFSSVELTGRRIKAYFPEIKMDGTSRNRNVADLKKKDGSLIRAGYSCSPLRTSSDPMTDEPELTSCKVITLQDISKIEQMEKQVREAEKMAAIGELSASIAHDFRNPLAAISGSGQVLAMNFNGHAEEKAQTRHSLIEIILRESERMNKTITDFLHYARPDSLQLQWFNLSRLARETVGRVNGDNGGYPECSINIDIPPELEVCGDPLQLQIALSHLLDNSCYASSATLEPVTVSAWEKTEHDRAVITIEVKDSGSGIPSEIKDRIFNPFFSTRVNAAGLGLAIVHQIIKEHEGTIKIESRQGKGCTVRIRLPMPEMTH